VNRYADEGAFLAACKGDGWVVIHSTRHHVYPLPAGVRALPDNYLPHDGSLWALNPNDPAGMPWLEGYEGDSGKWYFRMPAKPTGVLRYEAHDLIGWLP
jgi:hypothetical protein